MSAQSLRLLDLNAIQDSDLPATDNRVYCRPNQVTVAAGDILPLLADAALTNRAWIEDFAEDTIEIPQDLYEVLLAYRRFRSEAA